MKACVLVLLSMAWSGMLMAAPPEQAPRESQPDQDLGEVKIEGPVKLEKAIAPEDAWAHSNHGIIGQFIRAPNVFAPINPMARSEAGYGMANLNKDTVTGRIMGLDLIKFDF